MAKREAQCANQNFSTFHSVHQPEPIHLCALCIEPIHVCALCIGPIHVCALCIGPIHVCALCIGSCNDADAHTCACIWMCMDAHVHECLRVYLCTCVHACACVGAFMHVHGLRTPKDWPHASKPFGFNWILNSVAGAGTRLVAWGSDPTDSRADLIIAQGHPANCMVGPWVHGSLSPCYS